MVYLKDHLYFLKINNPFFLFVESISCFGCRSNADTRTKMQATSTDLIAVAFGLFNLRQRIVGISTVANTVSRVGRRLISGIPDSAGTFNFNHLAWFHDLLKPKRLAPLRKKKPDWVVLPERGRGLVQSVSYNQDITIIMSGFVDVFFFVVDNGFYWFSVQ